MRVPGYVPSAVPREPDPGPGGDVRVNCGATVGKYVIRELERALMELMEGPRCGDVSCENCGGG